MTQLDSYLNLSLRCLASPNLRMVGFVFTMHVCYGVYKGTMNNRIEPGVAWEMPFFVRLTERASTSPRQELYQIK
jgi:hypothetical protein